MASAAKSIPQSMFTTEISILPRTRPITSAILNTTTTAKLTTSITQKMLTTHQTFPCTALVNKMIEAIAPGPAIKGIHKGKTDGRCRHIECLCLSNYTVYRAA